MKKSLIALALIGAFSSAAVAQSNVTMYGILDVNYMWQQGPTNVGTTAAPRIQQESVNAINGGHQSGNRWGVRGTEALGGGLNAIFALEAGFNIDSGTSAQGGRLFGRQAYAGLSGGWGAVVAGRLATFSSGTGDLSNPTPARLTASGPLLVTRHDTVPAADPLVMFAGRYTRSLTPRSARPCACSRGTAA